MFHNLSEDSVTTADILKILTTNNRTATATRLPSRFAHFVRSSLARRFALGVHFVHTRARARANRPIYEQISDRQNITVSSA